MKHRVVFTALALALSAVTVMADFNSVLSAIESTHHARRKWIPFLGIARIAARKTHPDGIHDFRLVSFYPSSVCDSSDVPAIMAREMKESGYQNLVTAIEKNGDITVMYVKPLSPKLVRVLLFARDSEDVVLLQADVDPEHIDDLK